MPKLGCSAIEEEVDSFPSPFWYVYTLVQPSYESLTSYLAILWVEVGQPCLTTWMATLFLLLLVHFIPDIYLVVAAPMSQALSNAYA